MNITESYENHSKAFPEKKAIETAHESLTYKDLFTLISKTANWFQSKIGSTKYVGILMPNGIPFLQLFLGVAKAGGIASPLDCRWKKAELENYLTLLKPSIVITTKAHFQKIKDIYQQVIFWEDCCDHIWNTDVKGLHKQPENIPFYLGFTSGSTGEPKAFIRSHESWIHSFDCTKFDFGVEKQNHVLIPGALIHSHFLYGAVSTLFLGGTVYLLEKFSPHQSLTLLKRYPISVIYVVPTMIEAFLKEKHSITKKVKIISSGAKLKEQTKQRILEVYKEVEMFELYGASELSFVTTFSHQDINRKPNSVGKPCHNVDLQIRKGHELAERNEVGKIYVKSKMVFDGYLQKETGKVQSTTDHDGWMTVDDIGYVDEDGYLYIVGREKNMILYGGINIYPEEIETVLSSHPQVEAAVVIGLNDSYWGKIVTAVIKGTTNKSELRSYCKSRLASYKIPRSWYFVETIPLTTSGKIARPFIQKMIEERKMIHK